MVLREAISKRYESPAVGAMLEFARSGDTIYIHDFSRLARNTQDLLRLVQRMQQKEIQLISCQEQIDTATATGKLMLTMIAAINEFERSICWSDKRKESRLQKERSGIRGGKRIQQPDSFELLYGRYRDHKVTKSEIARQLEISRPTVDRLIKEMETGHKGKS